MSTAANYSHIELDDAGVARVANSRYKVCQLAAEHHLQGWTAEELMKQHPDLKPAEIYSALSYFYDHFDAMVAEIKSREKAGLEQRPANQVTRAELMEKRASVKRHE